MILFACADSESPPQIQESPELIKVFNEASMAFGKRQYVESMFWADSALVISPGFPKALELQGDLWRELRIFEKSDSTYRAILERNKNTRGIRFKIGTNAFLVERYNDAIAEFNKELELSKEAPIEILAQIGRSYQLQGNREETERYYAQVLERDSTFAPVYPWLADLAEEEGKMEEAYNYARKALALQGADPEQSYKVGLLAQRTQRFDEAVHLLEQVILVLPSHEGAHYQLGMALTQLGKTEEAAYFLAKTDSLQNLYSKIATAKLGADNHPTNPAEWIRLAQLYRQVGKNRDARDALNRAKYWVEKGNLMP